MVSALAGVRDAIARAVLGDTMDRDVTVGAITLRSHQRDALHRVRASIEAVGGALLADEPGLGKTFVALALAHEYGGALVVAPAALRTMWRDAAATARIEISFVSLEALSRADVSADANVRLVVVDEAHHACNPATARYARLARLVAYRHVLLLSATPVRNRDAELAGLLALFMGPRAHSLGESGRSLCIIRRGGDATLLPAIDGPHWRNVRSIAGLQHELAHLPPALPALDGRAASALIVMTLARSWASSLAALDTALRRRLQRGAALDTILDEGRLPTRSELRAWVVGDDSMQLSFPVFVTHETPDPARFRRILDAHLHAVRAIRDRIRARVEPDSDMRARMLIGWREAHRGARIVAFAGHAATADAIYRSLRRQRGVALLTARGAQTAGGARPRSDIISALGNAAARTMRDDISLVITTDLLSEGVNLQGASVIVHLDVPWTSAALDQRVGRAARMGSSHSHVHVYGLAAPAGAQRLLALDRRLRRKHAAQIAATAAPAARELLRAAVGAWQTAVSTHPTCEVAAVRAARPGFIAVIANDARSTLLCGRRNCGSWKLSDAPLDLLKAVRDASGGAVAAEPWFESGARLALRRWLAHRRAGESIGTAAHGSSRARRALLARIDHHAVLIAPHTRAAISARVARVRALVECAVSAGAERTIGELAHTSDTGLESLLSACEARLVNVPIRAARAGGEQTIRALLLLYVP